MTTTSTAAPTHCYTHTGTVHVAIVERDGRLRPACAGNAVHSYHFTAPTADAVTCRRAACSAPVAADPADKKARAAARRAADKRATLVRRTEAPARRAPALAERVARLAGVGTAEALADLAGAVADYAAIVADAREAAEQLAKLDA